MAVMLRTGLNLDEILTEKSPLLTARGKNYDIPFGGIVLRDGRVVLCIIDLISVPEGHLWRAVPLGLRKDNSTRDFDGKEKYHEPFSSVQELERLLLHSPRDISEFIATVRLRPDYPTWSNYDHPLDRQIYPSIVNEMGRLGLEKGVVLEIGCGIGKLAEYMQKAYLNSEVYALDANPDNVTEARKRLGSSKVKQANAEELGSVFSGVKFDAIVANAFFEPEVLGYGPAARDIVMIVRGQLKRGGYLVASGYTALLTTRQVLGNAGFNVLNTVVPENLFNYNFPKQMYVAQNQC